MKILLGITGSVSAYKTPWLVRDLRRLGHDVRVVMTPSARQFVAPLALEAVTTHPVIIDPYDPAIQEGGSWHVHLARWADVVCIAPCSATTLARLATGMCDTALMTVVCSRPAETPLIVFPAMDSDMWLQPATRRNVEQLRSDGITVVDPESGELASGLIGHGRLPEIETIVKKVTELQSDGGTEVQRDGGTEVPKDGSTEVRNDGITELLNDGSTEVRNDTITELLNDAITELRNDGITELLNDGSTEVRNDEMTEITQSVGDSILERLSDSVIPSFSDSVIPSFSNSVIPSFSNSVIPSLRTSVPPSLSPSRHLLITAGPTHEKIDAVRSIVNHSTGTMGFALATAAQRRGYLVTLVAGPVRLPTPFGVERIDVTSAAEMYEAVMRHREETDVFIMSAAVADFTPEEPLEQKLKKDSVGGELTLHLKRTADVLAELGRKKEPHQRVVGFALETGDVVAYASQKLVKKNADMIVANAADAADSGFGLGKNTITIITNGAVPSPFPPMSKNACAEVILDAIERL